MKLIQYTDDGSRALITILFDDGTYAITDVISGDRPKDDILKDAYIILKNTDRAIFEGDPRDFDNLILSESKVNSIDANFYELTGKVYDQYGDPMDKEIQFEIQGTDKARIENNKLIEEEVEEITSYFIVASCGELVQKEERYIYPPAPIEPETESPTDALAKELTKLKIDNMKEKAVNANLGKEVTKLKLDMMKLQGGKLE